MRRASFYRIGFLTGVVNNILYCKATILFYNNPEQEVVTDLFYHILIIFKNIILLVLNK